LHGIGIERIALGMKLEAEDAVVEIHERSAGRCGDDAGGIFMQIR
jgi:hypothetical protein